MALLAWEPGRLLAQNYPTPHPPPAGPLTLAQCLSYALAYQPLVRQARLDESVADANNRVPLAAWLPQLAANGTAQHYFGLPFTVFPDPTTGISTPRQLGVKNVTTVGLAGTQVIYNNDVNLAARQAPLQPAGGGPEYDFHQNRHCLGCQQGVLRRAAVAAPAWRCLTRTSRRLQRNFTDAHNRFEAGIVDKTDYLQAEISLNNSLAGRKQSFEAVQAKTSYLQQLIGLPADRLIALKYDTLQLEQEAVVDTLEHLDPANRIELQQVADPEDACSASTLTITAAGFCRRFRPSATTTRCTRTTR
ncbi:MAG: TolC family protein [Hymenobacter sp.]